MEKVSKYPIYVIGHKHGNVAKIKSCGELNLYKEKFGYNFTELDHYPSKEEVETILNSIEEKNI